MYLFSMYLFIAEMNLNEQTNEYRPQNPHKSHVPGPL